MGSKLPSLICFGLFLMFPCSAFSGDVEALLSLKTSLDAHHRLPWRRESGDELCSRWPGVKQCSPNGRVIKLVLEFLNLTGSLTTESLSPLDQLRVLSFKSNSLSGQLPDLSVLSNLKALYLNDNLFSGQIPASLAFIHRLKTVFLSNNQLSGDIPASITTLSRLYSLQLQTNRLTGAIPALNQPTLRFLNLSGNNFSGEIPATPALSRFNESSFLNNPGLCGAQIRRSCSKNQIFPPSPATKPPISSSHRRNRKKLAAIVAGSVAGFLLLLICLVLVFIRAAMKKRNAGRSKAVDGNGAIDVPPTSAAAATGGGGGGGGGKVGFSWEGEGLGKLVFVGEVTGLYSLEDLLRASAETLGRGTVGSTYKAVMESGFIVTVKRLTETATAPPSPEEFQRRMEELGRLRHPNLVALRAYFQAKAERLLVYDYFPNGSLFSLIHGSRPSGSGKPLHWTSCLKIAEDVATGLLHLHQSGAIHGNLKSSNVLLGPDFESCLTDFSLLLRSPDPDFTSSSSSSSSSPFHRAPECRHPRRSPFSPSSDIYSFGALLLELLTGKTPFQDPANQRGAETEIPAWVRAVRDEERETGASNGGDAAADDKLEALLGIATSCLGREPEMRPATGEVLRMVREARAEGAASMSSNSSGGGGGENDGQSPGRWSDAVRGLPREHGAEHLGFAERN